MDSTEPSGNVPLPDNADLLTTRELLGLLTEHRDQLQSYVTKFHPLSELEEQIEELRHKLQELQRKFDELQIERHEVTEEIEQLKICESEYVKQWQDLQGMIRDNYSDEAMKRKVQLSIRQLDEQCNQLELSLNTHTENKLDSNSLDTFVNEYLEKRKLFHLQREKLATWDAQGRLKS
ncbi:hypothetical protein NCAS_0C03320 [Naumovozyma castellii]|uniref:VPS37 C-terminal domain-containing protein n=1 Tax=Naumovozyma castellii TaxID=27288 RepID=G0VCW1_NAUCA|nr:hypothetical protein NCAS_0C03320 [Naumovozyma castellii CBS 4309]CCC69322.1 hypothetical protein NCAS_0C03320 [Naumovozyma castellii CBS 4309]